MKPLQLWSGFFVLNGLNCFVHKTGIHFWVIVALWAVVHLVLFQKLGFRSLHDADYYISEADFYITHRHFQDISFFYLLPIGIFTFFRILEPHGILFLIVFQSVFSLVAAFCLYHSSGKLFDNKRSALITAILFLLWIDNIQWNLTAMTESLFCSLTCILIYVLVTFKSDWRYVLYVLVLSVLIMMTRPTGVLIMGGVMCFLLVIFRVEILASKRVLYGLSLSFLAGFTVLGYIMAHSYDLEDQYSKGNIITYMDMTAGKSFYSEYARLDVSGLEISDREASMPHRMYYFITHNPGFILKSAAMKIGYLLAAVRPYYSNVHNMYISGWMLMIYTLFAMGIRQTKNVQVKVFVVAVILFNCFIVGLSTIDWDNRFYIPMEPGIVLLAGGAIRSQMMSFRFVFL
jgi:hypothetical protein